MGVSGHSLRAPAGNRKVAGGLATSVPPGTGGATKNEHRARSGDYILSNLDSKKAFLENWTIDFPEIFRVCREKNSKTFETIPSKIVSLRYRQNGAQRGEKSY